MTLLRLTSSRLLLSGITLAVASLSYRNSLARAFCSYSSSIFVLSIAWSIPCIAAMGLIPSETYYGGLAGVVLGVILGVGTGVLLGRKATHSAILYWLFVLLVVVIFITIPF